MHHLIQDSGHACAADGAIGSFDACGPSHPQREFLDLIAAPGVAYELVDVGGQALTHNDVTLPLFTGHPSAAVMRNRPAPRARSLGLAPPTRAADRASNQGVGCGAGDARSGRRSDARAGAAAARSISELRARGTRTGCVGPSLHSLHVGAVSGGRPPHPCLGSTSHPLHGLFSGGWDTLGGQSRRPHDRHTHARPERR